MSAFSIRPGEPAARALTRIMRAQLNAARRRLEGWEKNPEGAFHEARRRLKKLRAAARLAREIDEEASRAIAADARDAARALGATRDADVVRAAAEALAAEIETKDEAASTALTRLANYVARTSAEVADRAAQTAEALHILASTPARLTRIAQAPERPRDLKRAAKRIVKRADYAFARAHPDDADAATTAEARHEWRKRVKDVWYAGRMMSQVWPLKRPARTKLAADLGRLLGEERDLLLLADMLKRNARACGGAAARDAALAAVEAKRASIAAAAAPLGRRLHARNAKQTAKQKEKA
jgi:CHAD domain-containing protein